MPEVLPVVAAIPNYNMADYLSRLLPQVLAQGYRRVFVLDDASTDHTVDAVREFGDAVTLVRSPRNQGAGRNRNQILDHVDDETLIHFIDADMDLLTTNTASVAADLYARYAPGGVGVIGGLVRRADGTQEPYNYGPVFSLPTHLTGGFPPAIDRLRRKPRLARGVARLGRSAMTAWPHILEEPAAVRTYWVHEGNMIVSARVFRTLGGYDPHIREHEAQDFAIRLQGEGVERQFDPSIETIHHHVDVRGRFRAGKQFEAAVYMMRKHGFKRYLTDR
ncbi:glycosyltransferase family 2 protein [Mycolicibacterium madagascariense]|uniref:glycosyltransferase family 2 protein n=1 Tax=Mycolicibacterium madagascariense TaxID=212765 RepID=UPI0013CFBCD0|nr:glycosyltransferase family 2 protein [Mycolicibacterium madagascariense]MCV7013308.1 glycosyltransferase [Mycolicibacterium madagascariense]